MIGARVLATTGAAAILASGAFAQCTIKITSVSTVNKLNQLATPAVGDNAYGLRVDFTVTGRPRAAYQIRFRLFSRENSFAVPTTTGRYSYWVWFGMASDEDLKWQVDIDPARVTGNTTPADATRTLTVLQRTPVSAVELFGPQRMVARQSMTMNWAPNSSVTSLEMITGAPYPARTQTTVSYLPQFGSLATLGTYGLQFTRRLSANFRPTQTLVGYTANVNLSSLRTNPGLLNRAAYPTTATIPANIRPYLLMENGALPSTVTGLAALADRWAPSSGRLADGPYRTARKLFRGTVAHLVYTRPSPTPLTEVIRQGRGDCVGFSELFAAACRHAGIPARVIYGATTTDSHAWTEIWLPTYGWVPQDATFADSMAPDGSSAPWFGVITDGPTRYGASMQGGRYTWRGTGGVTSFTTSLTLSSF